MEEKRKTLIEKLADVDPQIEEKWLMEEEPTVAEIHAAIRRSCIANKFIPIFMGSAKKNAGVQCLLDSVVRFLPAPHDV
jgi:elongation factor G